MSFKKKAAWDWSAEFVPIKWNTHGAYTLLNCSASGVGGRILPDTTRAKIFVLL
jgi:hypothetical protein